MPVPESARIVTPRKVPKPREARKRLLEALAALEDPAGFYRREVGNGSTDCAPAFTMGAVKALVKFALHDLGEPIDPWS